MSETPSGDEELEPASVEPVSETPSDFQMKMKTDQETWEAKVRAGLFTVQELAPEYFTAEELDPINAPKMCDLFTAEELEPLKNFTLMDCTVPLLNLLKEGARRMRSEKN